jgi:hypothetical protein
VIDRYHAGTTIAEALRPLSATSGPDLSDARVRRRIESAVLELLADASRPSARARSD